jgi:hypothetical protein
MRSEVPAILSDGFPLMQGTEHEETQSMSSAGERQQQQQQQQQQQGVQPLASTDVLSELLASMAPVCLVPV